MDDCRRSVLMLLLPGLDTAGDVAPSLPPSLGRRSSSTVERLEGLPR
jgi:hypothetical protein